MFQGKCYWILFMLQLTVQCSETVHKQLSPKLDLQPVIIDTDIGSFYDDFMALALAVKSPSVDIKLVVTCTDDTIGRAKIAAKLLTLFGRSDIPIGIGVPNNNLTNHPLFGWAEDFALSTYKGSVMSDGVAAMAAIIQTSSVPVDILSIGPMTNFPALLKRYPDVVKNARIRASGGSIYRGYYNVSKSMAEYNFKVCPYCDREVMHAGWSISIAPLDVTSVGSLTPDLMRVFLESTNLVTLAIGNSLVYYCSNLTYHDWSAQCNFSAATLVYYDAVATLLLMPNAPDFFSFKELNLTVNDDGYTVLDERGTPINVALNWSDGSIGLGKYRELLTATISSNS